MAREVVFMTGTYGEKKLITTLSLEELKTSSPWKIGDGEPPVGPGKAADLAVQSKQVLFPEFTDSVVREVSLVSTDKGCYYRVSITQKGDIDSVAGAGAAMKPTRMIFYVLLNLKVIQPR